MENAEAVAGNGSSTLVERDAMRETLRELLFEIPGFRALAERGIRSELLSTPPCHGGWTSHLEHADPAVAQEGRPRPPEGTTDSSRTVPNAADANPDSGASEQLVNFVRRSDPILPVRKG